MNKVPWEKSNLEIEVIDVYEGEIIGEEGKDYSIEFRDNEMEIVQDKWPRKRFRNFPYKNPWKLRNETAFGLVTYKEENRIKIGIWPIEKYWNPKLLE